MSDLGLFVNAGREPDTLPGFDHYAGAGLSGGHDVLSALPFVPHVTAADRVYGQAGGGTASRAGLYGGLRDYQTLNHLSAAHALPNLLALNGGGSGAGGSLMSFAGDRMSFLSPQSAIAALEIQPYTVAGAAITQGTLDTLAGFKPRTAGAELKLGNGSTLQQITGKKNAAGAVLFKGGADADAKYLFQEITGTLGKDIEQSRVRPKGMSDDTHIYRINVDGRRFVLRDISNSTDGWTIDLGGRMSNGTSEIKFPR